MTALHPGVTEATIVASFVVHGEPVSKARARFTNRGSKSRAYTPARTFQAEHTIAAAFRKAAARGYVPDPDATYTIEMDFYAWSRQRRDVDNMEKLVLDGLNGVAWVDDVNVTRLVGEKHLVSHGEERTEVRIYVTGKMPHHTRICVHCGASFNLRSRNDARKHCSRTCAYRARGHDLSIPIPCKQCAQPFRRTTTAQNMCSPECRVESLRGRNRARAHGPYSTCSECGKQLRHRRAGRCRECWRLDPFGKLRREAS